MQSIPNQSPKRFFLISWNSKSSNGFETEPLCLVPEGKTQECAYSCSLFIDYVNAVLFVLLSFKILNVSVHATELEISTSNYLDKSSFSAATGLI